jgi:hypothetical protein
VLAIVVPKAKEAKRISVRAGKGKGAVAAAKNGA